MVMLGCVVLHLLLYTISGFMKDFTRFNLYFAVDIMRRCRWCPSCRRRRGR